ncbi:MAG: adenine-specific methyltransferase EcoRI family protein [Mycoplasmoidaceae bacterium]|nr:adenine-specific methyltransferase EcoRI family protein [Mycoplasmoidaceae bacterium]
MPNKKKQLDKSKRKVNNEYYTVLEDIENEIQNYWPYLEGKRIWCNCDDPE